MNRWLVDSTATEQRGHTFRKKGNCKGNCRREKLHHVQGGDTVPNNFSKEGLNFERNEGESNCFIGKTHEVKGSKEQKKRKSIEKA